MEAQINDMKKEIPELKTYIVPGVMDFIEPKEEPQPFWGQHSRRGDARAVILHTSGSTGKLTASFCSRYIKAGALLLYRIAKQKSLGLPKPIVIRTNYLLTIPAMAELPEKAEADAVPITPSYFLSDVPMLAPLPFFHAMGLISLCRALMCYKPLILAPPVQISASLLTTLINERKPGAAVLAPSILEEFAGSDEGLRTLGKLDRIIFGGAPLGIAAGDKISKVTNLQPSLGSTETGMYTTLLPTAREDWAYFRFADVEGIEMQPVHENPEDDDGLREMVVTRRDLKYQGVFHTFPDIEEWRTKDLFMRHPTKEGYWKYQGRRDDVIVLSNGEKFNPVTTEKTLEGTSLLKGALVVGTGRFQAGLLLEPIWDTFKDDETAMAELIEAIWPLVEKANAEAPAHARIYRSKILVAKHEKPFLRAAKGSIMRKATNELYKEEIQAVFANEELMHHLGHLDPRDDLLTVKAFLRRAFELSIAKFKGPLATDNADIFAFGADSLGVLALSNAINHATTNSDKLMRAVTTRTIYDNPSIDKLANVLRRSMTRRQDSGRRDSAASGMVLSDEDRMKLMAEEYTHDFDTVKKRASVVLTEIPVAPKKHTVILTGSTGSLGNHTLAQLLRSDDVEMIYCFNRTLSAASRQHASLAAIGFEISEDDLASKCVFLKTDFSKTNFNIPSTIYTMLRQTVTVFIHNAWAVDFNMSLESYEDTHVHGVRRVVDFAARSQLRPRIIFISSIASVGNWNNAAGDEPLPAILESDSDGEDPAQQGIRLQPPVPETLSTVHNNKLPFHQGYAQSKHVSEQILATASTKLGLPVSIVRCGQLAGASEDANSDDNPAAAWNKHEWLPTLIQTSKALGKIPRTLGKQDRIDWVPMDRAAAALLDLVFRDSDTSVEDSANADTEEVSDELAQTQWLKKLQRSNTGGDKWKDLDRNTPCEVLHLVNPSATSWTELCPSVQTFFKDTLNTELEAVEYGAWVSALEKVTPTKESAEQYPGIKLLRFYEGLSEDNDDEAGLPVLETKRMESKSRTLRGLAPVNEGLMGHWLKQWAF